MKHLEIPMADAKDDFDLVAHQFQNLPPSIQSTLGSLPGDLLNELLFGSIAATSALTAFCNMRYVSPWPDCYQGVPHELN